MDQTKYIYLIGTAGSGKSTLCNSFGEWLIGEEANIIRINLDPGADSLPYEPDVDIRDWVDLYDIMQTYNLGPNGAQIASADRIALVSDKLRESIEDIEADYILIDTPGQIELFAFRNSSRVIIEQFDRDMSHLVFLMDPFLSLSPSGFISQLMLYITCQLRLPIPSVNVLSKSDMLTDEKSERILTWSRNPMALYDAALEEATTMGGQFNIEVLRSIIDMDVASALYRCSSETKEGMADIYNVIQQVFSGGDDIRDER